MNSALTSNGYRKSIKAALAKMAEIGILRLSYVILPV
jgi:hypothetical protein